MKKLKLILPVLMAGVMAFGLVFSFGCKKKPTNKPEEQPPVTTPEIYSLQSIALNTDNAKTVFDKGEEFSAEGLVIVATYKMTDDSTTTANLTATSEGITIDSDAYDATSVGEYTIRVEYRYSAAYRQSKQYTVTVKEPDKAGLDVRFKSGVNNRVELSPELFYANLSDVADKIEVRQPDKDGVIDDNTPVLTSGYTIEVYHNKDKVDESKLSQLDCGVYQIWVSMAYDKDPTYMLKGFERYYVVDTLESFTFASTEAGTETEQQLSLEKDISKTWKFKATYKSERVKTLTVDDVKVENFDATIMGDNQKAKISFSEDDGSGKVKTHYVDVNFSIKAPDTAITLERVFDFQELCDTIYTANPMFMEIEDQLVLESLYFATPGNKWLTLNTSVSSGKYTIRESNQCIEIRKGVLSFVVQDTATLTISIASTGGSNYSSIGVGTSESALLTADNFASADCNKNGIYTVKGLSYVTITYTLPKGTYTIFGGLDDGIANNKTSTRNVRVNAISLTDVVGGGN